MLSSFSDIEYLASPDIKMENEQDSLHAFSGDDTLEHSDSDAATIDYDDQDKVDDDDSGASNVQSLERKAEKEDVELNLLFDTYEPKVDDGIFSTEPSNPSPVKKARGRARKNSQLNIIDARGKVCNSKMTKSGCGRPRKLKKMEIFTCEKCGESLSGKVALKRHHRDEHRVKKVKSSYIKKKICAMYKRSDGPFTCELCGRIYPQYGELRRHQRRAHEAQRLDNNGERNFLCSTCGKAFLTKDTLTKHNSLHSGRTYPCSHCDQVLSSRASLCIHTKRKHTKVEAHICPICTKTLTHKTTLMQHMAKQHNDPLTDIAYHRCHECDKKYCTPGQLRRHQLAVHTNKRWTCGLCGLVYTYKSGYDKHMRSNHAPPGTKYKCEPCGLEFDKGGGLDHHQRRKCPHRPNRNQQLLDKAHVITLKDPFTMETIVVTQTSSNQSTSVENAAIGNHEDQSISTNINMDLLLIKHPQDIAAIL